jgi:arylsulfatase A-like enzyme
MRQHSRREFFTTTAGALAAAAGNRPNILLLFPDQHRLDWTGANPRVPVRTPNLDALARRGARFTRALVASPLCAPSRACLATGKEYDRCRVPSNGHDYPLDQTTYYSLLRDSGYHVAGCGKFDLHKATLDWGLDGKRLLPQWGFSDGIDNAGKHDAIRSGALTPKDPYMAYLHRRQLAAMHVEDFGRRKDPSATFPTPLPEEAYCDNWVANNGLDLMRRFPGGKPWFLMVNFTGPHEPWDITRRMEESCRKITGFPQPNGSRQFSPETHLAIRQNYSAMVENIDRWVGIFVEELKRRGELDNTLVVYSSDHGEMLGDHDRWGKSVPYQPSVGVPLYVAGPGVRAGLVSEALVSVMDLAATFLDYAALPRPADMDSRSLRPLLEGKTRSHRDYVLSGLGGWRLVFDGRYKLIRGFGSAGLSRAGPPLTELPPLLFDLESDPLENANIATKARAEVERLSKRLGQTIMPARP